MRSSSIAGASTSIPALWRPTQIPEAPEISIGRIDLHGLRLECCDEKHNARVGVEGAKEHIGIVAVRFDDVRVEPQVLADRVEQADILDLPDFQDCVVSRHITEPVGNLGRILRRRRAPYHVFGLSFRDMGQFVRQQPATKLAVGCICVGTKRNRIANGKCSGPNPGGHRLGLWVRGQAHIGERPAESGLVEGAKPAG